MLLLYHILLCISGVISTILIQYIYQITDPMLAIPMFALYLGEMMAFPGVFANQNNDQPIFNKLFIPIILTDIIGFTFTMISVHLAGGQLFTVAYASIIIWSALLKKIFLKQNLNFISWFSICLIMLGVGLSAISANEYGNYVEWGVICGILSAIVYSIQYVLSEITTTKYNTSPYASTMFIGLNGLIAVSVYILFYAIPRSLESDKSPIIDGYRLALSVFGMALSGLVHNISFFKISKTNGTENNSIYRGAVTIAVNKSLQTALSFIFVHVFFCHNNDVNCINTPKILSIGTVVIGIILYSFSGKIINRNQDIWFDSERLITSI